MLMAAARLNVPVASSSTAARSCPAGAPRARPSTSSACSRRSAPTPPGTLTADELALIERNACPTIGACAGMFTANTMASVGRGPRHVACPARRRRRPSTAGRDDFAYASGQAVMRLVEAGIRPRQILTKAAFENAIAVVNALGGSTNAVLHLLAIANEARVELELEDFNRVGRAGGPHRRHASRTAGST